MEHLINKDTLAAQIEKLQYEIRVAIESIPLTGREKADATLEYEILEKIKNFLDTLEAKKVDLKEEFDNYTNGIMASDIQYQPFTHLYNCAKHFFELGIKSK